MKKYIRFILLTTIIACSSCTDVVEVNVPEAAPRLVVEASIDWDKGTTGNEQTIKLSSSTPFFDENTNQIVTGASVKITNDSNNEEFIFADENNGEYVSTNFVPIINQAYTLEIIYNNETYIAKETMKAVSDFENVFQEIDNDDIVINVEFNDPGDQENYYLTKFKDRNETLPELFYDTDECEGGPLSTTPAPIKGNCSNITTPENYAFGYFRLSQMVQTSFMYSSEE